MIDTIGNIIKAVAGQPIGLSAQVIDETGDSITKNIRLCLYDDDKLLYCADGLYLPEFDLWQFEIPAEITEGLEGRYWYCFQYDGNNLCFKNPIYLVG